MVCHITRFLEVSGQRVAYELSQPEEVKTRRKKAFSFRFKPYKDCLQNLIKAASKWLVVERKLLQSRLPTSAQCQQVRAYERAFIQEVYKFKGYLEPVDADLALMTDALARGRLDIHQCVFQIRYSVLYLSDHLDVSERRALDAEEFCKDAFYRFRGMIDAKSDEVPLTITALIAEQ